MSKRAFLFSPGSIAGKRMKMVLRPGADLPLAHREAVGPALHFPRSFVRGDMSRGGPVLRRVEAGRELEYVPTLTASRRGPRPPGLDPR